MVSGPIRLGVVSYLNAEPLVFGLDRDPALLALELKQGLVSEQGARRYGVVLAGGAASMPGMVELGEEIFMKAVRRGVPNYNGALADMLVNPRAATVMGLLHEARMARARGSKAAAQSGAAASWLGRAKDWFLG